MKQLKVLIVANDCDWPSWPDKIQELRNWFSSKVDLVCSLTHVNLRDVPFVPYGSNDPDQNKIAGIQGINRQWYDQNVTPLANGYDIVLFVMHIGPDGWPVADQARGWRTVRGMNGAIELQVGANEEERLFYNGKDVGGTFFNFARHEILHALFMIIYGDNPATCPPNFAPAEHKHMRCDPTHYWWNQWQIDNALAEVEFPEPNATEKLLWKVYALYLLNKVIASFKSKTSRIKDWALAIQSEEGYYPPGYSAKFPDGSRSWRNNNPGNLRYVGQLNATGADRNGFAVFLNYDGGMSALVKMLTNAATGLSKVYRPEMTLEQFFQVYAPSSDGNAPVRYAEHVASRLGVDKSIVISSLV